jgi:hypothetical protein
MRSLRELEVHELVEKPAGVRLLQSKWVLKIKRAHNEKVSILMFPLCVLLIFSTHLLWSSLTPVGFSTSSYNPSSRRLCISSPIRGETL